MNGGTLVKIPESIVSIPLDKIKWGEIMLVDPRDYVVSPENARRYNKDRNIKMLEDSILSVGFRNPLWADEHKEIVDGSRRLMLALKHGLMIPVIHVDYTKDIRDSGLLKAIDSILFNRQEPNSPKELGETVNGISLKTGIPISKIAEMIGVPWDVVNNWSQHVKIPEDVIPAEGQAPEIKETWSALPPRKRDLIAKINRTLEGTPKEKADTAKKLAGAGYAELDEVIRDLNAGENVDIEDRTKGSEVGIRTVPTKLEWVPSMLAMISQRAKARTWDTHTLIETAGWGVGIGELVVSQELYDRYKEARKAEFDRANKK